MTDLKRMLATWQKAVMWDNKKRGSYNRLHMRDMLVHGKMAVIGMMSETNDAVDYEPRGERWLTQEVFVPFGTAPMAIGYKFGASVVKNDDGYSVYFLCPHFTKDEICIVEFSPSVINDLGAKADDFGSVREFITDHGLLICRETSDNKIAVDLSPTESYIGELDENADAYHVKVIKKATHKRHTKKAFYDDVSKKLLCDIRTGVGFGKLIANILTPEEILQDILCKNGYNKRECEYMSVFFCNVVNTMDVLGYERIFDGNTLSDDIKTKLADCGIREYGAKVRVEAWQPKDMLPYLVKLIQSLHPDAKDKNIALALLITLAAKKDNASLVNMRTAYRYAACHPEKNKAVWGEVDEMMCA